MLFLQTSPCSREWVSGVKLEAIGLPEKRVEGIAFGLHGIHSSVTCVTREERGLSTHTYASEGGRESNQYLAYSRWDELGPLQLGMEDNTVNLIGVQKGLVDI